MTRTTGLLGYCSPLSIQPGQGTELKISSNGPEACAVEVLRIICGDIDPSGPGESYEPQDWGGEPLLAVRHQRINAGSFAMVHPAPKLEHPEHLTFSLHVFPTRNSGGDQVLFHWGDLTIRMTADGHVCAGAGSSVAMAASPLLLRHWYRVEATVSEAANRLSLAIHRLKPIGEIPPDEDIAVDLDDWTWPTAKQPLLLAAAFERLEGERAVTHSHFNGKIEAVTITNGRQNLPVAMWDFATDTSTDRMVDSGSQGCHGVFVNTPARAVTGHNWDSSVESWCEAPSQYAAVHFHDDDMTDCQWRTSLTITAPESARPGYYIARLTADGIRSDVPFFVSAKPGAPKAPLLLLAPTATYLSYANTHIKFDSHNTENLYEAPMVLSEDELYLNEHRELGLSHYDTHSDDSGVIYAGERRPMLNMRPGLYTFNYLNDTHIIKWLEQRGIAYDVATDEDLHRHGSSLLDGYRVVMTASHPEYYSTRMWDSLNDYQNAGGRHIYLGGNGFYWRIAYSDAHPGVIENRRGMSGVRTWEGEPGEHHLSFNGEPGGLWRTHGRAPQALVGTGFSSTLFVKSTWFRRSEASKEPQYDFVFRGVNSDVIGDFGYRGGGCVGLEIDRWDRDLGSPANSVILATSEYVGAGGLLTGEEFITTTRALDGVQNGKVRADMVFFTTAGGGAVWSTGSIAWATSLLWNGGENSVSRITANVLERFLDSAPFGDSSD